MLTRTAVVALWEIWLIASFSCAAGISLGYIFFGRK